MASLTSVIMPVCNGRMFIREALDSVLGQLEPDDEILVVDDASTDGTWSVLAPILDPRIRVLHGLGHGVSSARNIGLASAKGEFVAFLDHDDLWPATRHSIMVQALMADPKLDVVFGRIRIRLDVGGIMWPFLLNQDGLHAPGSNLGNALYRSKVLRRIDGFDERLHFGVDLDYLNRLQKTGIRFALCDVDGMIYRRHTANITNDQQAMKNMHFDLIRRRRNRTSTSGRVSVR